jgi:hypothetical protein
MFQEKRMVNWPCIIKYSDDAELVYVNDQSEWDNDSGLHLTGFDESDRLIDSSGDIYVFNKPCNQYVNLEASGDSMSLVEILGLVKAHAAQKGSCCVAKLYAPTIRDAYRIVASLNEA